MMKRIAGWVVGVSLVVLVGGCSPKGSPLAAVALDGQGRPIAVVAPCRNDGIVAVSVYENGEGGGAVWRATGVDPIGAREVQIFSPPPGWTVTDDSLRSLSEGRAYALTVGPLSGRSIDSVPFRSQDLTGLQPDQVWGYHEAGDKAPQALSRTAFEKEAAASCE